MHATKDAWVLNFFTSLCTEELNDKLNYKKNYSRSSTLHDEFNFNGENWSSKNTSDK